MANRRLKTLENLESLFGHPPSRIGAVHGVLPCSVQIPTVATRTGLCDGCFGASITCFWWLDCEGCHALMTLRFQKQQHASLNTAYASTTFALDNEPHSVHFVVRSSRVFTRVWKSKTTAIVMHLRSSGARPHAEGSIHHHTSCLALRQQPQTDSPFPPHNVSRRIESSPLLYITCMTRSKDPPDVKRGSASSSSPHCAQGKFGER